MANKYLDETGLSYFWGKVKTFFAPDTNPLAPGTANKGTSSKFARQDHVHPAQTAEDVPVSSAVQALFDRATDVDDVFLEVKENLDAKVDKVSGKGLSTNDYTTAEKNKLAGIASGAEVNVQADWSVTDTSSDAFIKNKPTIDSALSSTSTNAVQNKVINTALSGKVDKVSGKGLSTNDYTTAEKNKLAGIAAGAEVNQNAFSIMQLVGGASVSAIRKTSTLNLKPGSNISLTAEDTNDDGANDQITVAVGTSPAFTGTPTAPTATAGTNNTQIATTAFVNSAISTAISGASSFQGTVSANSTISNSNYKKGWYWVVATAGTYVGETCEVGDMIFAIKDKGSAYAASNFSVVQSNLDLVAITNAEIDAIVA